MLEQSDSEYIIIIQYTLFNCVYTLKYLIFFYCRRKDNYNFYNNFNKIHMNQYQTYGQNHILPTIPKSFMYQIRTVYILFKHIVSSVVESTLYYCLIVRQLPN